jgi:hypothetical protein
VEQQESKLRHTGLDREVTGRVISEGAAGRNAGVTGVWLHRGRRWPVTAFAPDHVADGFPHAAELALTAGG